MSKRRSRNVNRLLLTRWASGGAGEDRLWDREGTLWVLAVEALRKDEARTLFMDHAVPVAIHDGASTMTWVEPADRRKRWAELEARTFDPAWKPPSGAPGSRRFTAQRWRTTERSLLLFDDHD